MLVQNDIIPVLGQSTGTAEPNKQESTIGIDQVFRLTSQVPSRFLPQVTVGGVATTSFQRTYAQTLTAGAQASVTHITLTPGLWKIGYNIIGEFNFVNGTVNAVDVVWDLRDASLLAFMTLHMEGARIGRFFHEYAAREYIIDRNLNLTSTILTNAAGQTSQTMANFYCAKLL